jgi:hypothetical protein
MAGWKSYIDLERDAVHVVPCRTDPAHELTAFCWCNPVEEIMNRSDGTGAVLVSHNHEL